MNRSSILTAILTSIIISGCGGTDSQQSTNPEPEKANTETANEFVDRAESELLETAMKYEQASWVNSNFITHDTDMIASQANEVYTVTGVRLANESKQFTDVQDPEIVRKLNMIRTTLVLPAPSDPAKAKELSQLATELNSMYGKGQYCNQTNQCKTLGELSDTLAVSREPAELLEAWNGWRTISVDMKPKFARLVEIANEGARELGYTDLGAMWRSKYDMAADDFATELDRLWGQVEPLYTALQCKVRADLADFYGSDVVDDTKPIPAHLLGNMWSQSWANVYPIVAPKNADQGFDLTEIINTKGMSELDMVRAAEDFFVSLDLDPLPETFWERSLFVKPADREVVCHASAWNLDWKDDLRIKMCIKKDAEDFQTIHHELGHNYYQRAYNQKSFLYANSANDGFHEALGDTVALSVTPEYLQQIGLLETVPDSSSDIGLLLNMALEKIAFIPFGLLVDQWRWKVFSGEVGPDQYNEAWWQLREKYQGVMAPNERTDMMFDPGAKYHVPGNVPYTRYFLAHILQFQMHRALCEKAGNTSPLHRCTIYNNKAAGKALNEMMEMGSSRPWQDALEALTGQRDMDASAIMDYFAPLKDWLDQQNEGRQCGW